MQSSVNRVFMRIGWQNKGFRRAKFEYWSILLVDVYVCKPPMDVAYRQRKVSLYRCTLSDSNQPLFKLKFVCKNWNRCEHWIACVSNFLPTATWIADLCSTLRRFLSAYIRSYMLHIPNSAEENCLTEKENHTLCLKSDIKPKKLGITKM